MNFLQVSPDSLRSFLPSSIISLKLSRNASLEVLLSSMSVLKASLDSLRCSLPSSMNFLQVSPDSSRSFLPSSMSSFKLSRNAALDSLLSSISSFRVSLDSLRCCLLCSMSSLSAAEFSSCCFERTLLPQSIAAIPLPIRRHCNPPTTATTQIFNSINAKVAASNSVIFVHSSRTRMDDIRVLLNARATAS